MFLSILDRDGRFAFSEESKRKEGVVREIVSSAKAQHTHKETLCRYCGR
jgi:hypothetical protein